jgi:hypothetical protein
MRWPSSWLAGCPVNWDNASPRQFAGGTGMLSAVALEVATVQAASGMKASRMSWRISFPFVDQGNVALGSLTGV